MFAGFPLGGSVFFGIALDWFGWYHGHNSSLPEGVPVSKSNAAENHLIAWIFNGTPIPWAGVSMIYVSLHTADPGEAGNQSTNEASYTGYARVGLSRDSNGWALSGMGSASNRSTVSFPQCTGGSEILSHVAIGTAATGGGTLLYSGPLNASLAVSGQIQPVLGEGTLQVSES